MTNHDCDDSATDFMLHLFMITGRWRSNDDALTYECQEHILSCVAAACKRTVFGQS